MNVNGVFIDPGVYERAAEWMASGTTGDGCCGTIGNLCRKSKPDARDGGDNFDPIFGKWYEWKKAHVDAFAHWIRPQVPINDGERKAWGKYNDGAGRDAYWLGPLDKTSIERRVQALLLMAQIARTEP